MQCYKTKNADPKDVLKSSLALANKYKHLNFFVRICSDEATEQAQKSSERWKNRKTLGPLDGVPVAIKDNFCVKGMPTTCASKYVNFDQ